MRFSTSDTIVAIATPPGRGGIGVVRISGGSAAGIAAQLIRHRGPLGPRLATFTTVRFPAAADSTSSDDAAIDQAVVTFFPGPHSYTGEDVVEISAHGSPVVLRRVVEAATIAGARLAAPGEFTLRAFLNGRMDLMQAEGVADLIDAVTPLQARVAFDQLEGTLTRTIADIDAALFDLIAKLEASVDFPEEGYHFIEPGEIAHTLERLLERTTSLLADARRGRLIRDGFQVAITGRPNVGKSSLFNALVGAPRAIVTDVPGTTRDLVTETIDLDGYRVTLIDTAGMRRAADAIEAEGVARSRGAQQVADLVLVVVDDDAPEVAGLTEVKHFVVQNKCDLERPRRGVRVSAATGEGLDELRRAIVGELGGADGADSAVADRRRDRPALTNLRHARLVEAADAALRRARDAALAPGGAAPEEILLIDLQEARGALEEITGRRATEDLLERIFSRFCVGK